MINEYYDKVLKEKSNLNNGSQSIFINSVQSGFLQVFKAQVYMAAKAAKWIKKSNGGRTSTVLMSIADEESKSDGSKLGEQRATDPQMKAEG